MRHYAACREDGYECPLSGRDRVYRSCRHAAGGRYSPLISIAGFFAMVILFGPIGALFAMPVLIGVHSAAHSKYAVKR